MTPTTTPTLKLNTAHTPWSNRYFLGLDLGKSADFTALAVVERQGDAKDGVLLVRHLQRWPLMTPYTTVVSDLCAVLRSPVFLGQTLPEFGADGARLAQDSIDWVLGEYERREITSQRPYLLIDYTGVGSAVFDLFAQAKPRALLHPVLITAGRATSRDKGVWHTAKIELVSAVQRGLQTDRLRVAQALPDAALLQNELRNFEMKITDSANAVFNAREGQHDDLVLAVAMAVWIATSPLVNQEFHQGDFFR